MPFAARCFEQGYWKGTCRGWWECFSPQIRAYAPQKGAGSDKLKVSQIIGFPFGQILIMEGWRWWRWWRWWRTCNSIMSFWEKYSLPPTQYSNNEQTKQIYPWWGSGCECGRGSTLKHLWYSWVEAIQWLILLKILTIWKVYLRSQPLLTSPVASASVTSCQAGAAVWRYRQREWLTVWVRRCRLLCPCRLLFLRIICVLQF